MIGRTKILLKSLKRPIPIGIAIGVAAMLVARAGNSVTSSDSFCETCHVHPQATSSWKMSTHNATQSGTIIHCVECHLPPGGAAYFVQKTRTGIRDAVGTLLKDSADFDWDERSQLEHAVTHVFKESCVYCHANLFPIELSDKGEEAHLHYEQLADEIRCIKCHLHVGHYDPDATQEIDFGLTTTEAKDIYTAPARVDAFEDFTEFIPGTSVSFEMVAIPGGGFTMGSPGSERYRSDDEGPQVTVTLSPFWIGKVEVTWDEFEAWYRATAGEGRTDTRMIDAATGQDVDALTGATPPYVPPDQGWGKGDRPAITMTYHAALMYTRWLSEVTGKRYRLPTEAEWEYAARGGTSGAYFFDGDPKKYSERRLWNRIFGASTQEIDRFVIHSGNSGGKTQPPSEVEPNPFGLLNMSGNVKEFCLDWYAPDTYTQHSEGAAIVDPRGPAEGSERVVRGGSFNSDPADMRSAARESTRTDACLMTDPQKPKSLWWYSDCEDIGFRVVLELDTNGSG